jgi:hypothetical protein
LEALDFRPFERNETLSTYQFSALTVSHDKVKIGRLLTFFFVQDFQFVSIAPQYCHKYIWLIINRNSWCYLSLVLGALILSSSVSPGDSVT